MGKDIKECIQNSWIVKMINSLKEGINLSHPKIYPISWIRRLLHQGNWRNLKNYSKGMMMINKWRIILA